jgi:hypothetical protein
MDAEIVICDNNPTIMAQSQTEMAPGEQAINESEHRPLLKVDRTGGITGARHIVIPVDDTEVGTESLHCFSVNNFLN